jgi:hypothetical protein
MSYSEEDWFKDGTIVYVEPGRGYGRILCRLQPDLLAVTLLDEPNTVVHAEEDNVFKIHGEHYYNRMESLMGNIMDSAGNYEINDDFEENLNQMQKLADVYRLALANGQK